MTQQEREGFLLSTETLKNMMTTCASGGSRESADYAARRQELMSHTETQAKQPRFVQTCRNLSEFWGFIQPKFPSYKQR